MDNPANQVQLIGRVSCEVQHIELPSGDVIASFRLVVPRVASSRGKRKSKQKVDVFDCTAWSAKAKKAATRLSVDDTVCVEGQLRRSFKRSAGAPMSFVGVDVSACSRVTALSSSHDTRGEGAG